MDRCQCVGYIPRKQWRFLQTRAYPLKILVMFVHFFYAGVPSYAFKWVFFIMIYKENLSGYMWNYLHV